MKSLYSTLQSNMLFIAAAIVGSIKVCNKFVEIIRAGVILNSLITKCPSGERASGFMYFNFIVDFHMKCGYNELKMTSKAL